MPTFPKTDKFLCLICKHRTVLSPKQPRKYVCIDCDRTFSYPDLDIPIRCEECAITKGRCMRCNNLLDPTHKTHPDFTPHPAFNNVIDSNGNLIRTEIFQP